LNNFNGNQELKVKAWTTTKITNMTKMQIKNLNLTDDRHERIY